MVFFIVYRRRGFQVSVENNCCIDDNISKLECEKMLISELGFWHKEVQINEAGPPWRYLTNESSLCITIREITKADDPAYWLSTDVYGFAPSLSLRFRSSLTYLYAVSSADQEMLVVDFMLRNTKGNFGYSAQFEKPLIQRRNGKVFVRQDFEKWKNVEVLDKFISVPFERMLMKP
jgi:hypothetical protein